MPGFPSVFGEEEKQGGTLFSVQKLRWLKMPAAQNSVGKMPIARKARPGDPSPRLAATPSMAPLAKRLSRVGMPSIIPKNYLERGKKLFKKRMKMPVTGEPENIILAISSRSFCWVSVSSRIKLFPPPKVNSRRQSQK